MSAIDDPFRTDSGEALGWTVDGAVTADPDKMANLPVARPCHLAIRRGAYRAIVEHEDGSVSVEGTGIRGQRWLCHLCDEPAVSRLVFRRSDGTEAGRTQPKCRRHYHEALDLWDNFREVVPEAVGDLTVLVSA